MLLLTDFSMSLRSSVAAVACLINMIPFYHQVNIAASAYAVAGEIPFNQVCSPLIRWLAVAGGLPIWKLLVQ